MLNAYALMHTPHGIVPCHREQIMGWRVHTHGSNLACFSVYFLCAAVLLELCGSKL